MIRFIANLPTEAGACVGICQYQDRIIIACEYWIYEMALDSSVDDYRIRPIEPDIDK